MDLRAGESVLDVACGNGTATLAAARRFCRTTGSTTSRPPRPRRERARADRLEVSFQVADAEALPFEDGHFDAAISTFGVMFTSDHQRAAAEMVRVVRPGGQIGLANWTPDGFVGQLFSLIGRTVPPPPGVPPPPLWGTLPYCEALFGDIVTSVQAQHRDFVFRYTSPEHFIDVFRSFYGPIHRLYEALPADRAAAFTHDFRQLIGRFNRSNDGTAVDPLPIPGTGRHPLLSGARRDCWNPHGPVGLGERLPASPPPEKRRDSRDHQRHAEERLARRLGQRHPGEGETAEDERPGHPGIAPGAIGAGRSGRVRRKTNTAAPAAWKRTRRRRRR